MEGELSLEDTLKAKLESKKIELENAKALVERLESEVADIQQDLEMHQFSNELGSE